MKIEGIRRKIYRCGLIAGVLSCIAIVISSQIIDNAVEGRIYNDVAKVPHKKLGLLLGCSKQLKSGRENQFFTNRINAAVSLYKAGKVEQIIVSGDNSQADYDEPTDMKQALVAAGVPGNRVYCDYAGFRTLDSVVRAKHIFQAEELTVISQEFHTRRAVFIAGEHGLSAVGFNAAEVDVMNSFKTKLREQLAKVKTILDVYILGTEPKFYGPVVKIATRHQ